MLENYLTGARIHSLRIRTRDWLIIRPGFLTDVPVTGNYRAITDLTGIKAVKISRADVAHLIIEELDSARNTGFDLFTPCN